MKCHSHPEPRRKTNQYPGGHLPDDTVFERSFCESAGHSWSSDGRHALEKSIKAALAGLQFTNEISCLRGRLRKAVIQLASDIRLSMPFGLILRNASE